MGSKDQWLISRHLVKEGELPTWQKCRITQVDEDKEEEEQEGEPFHVSVSIGKSNGKAECVGVCGKDLAARAITTKPSTFLSAEHGHPWDEPTEISMLWYPHLPARRTGEVSSICSATPCRSPI